MARSGPPRRPGVAPTTLHEIARRYYATAVALAKAMGRPMSETFLREHRESISCCFIEAGRAGVRLPPAVQLPPLAGPTVEAPAEAGEIQCTGMPTATEAPTRLVQEAMDPADIVPDPPANGHTPPVAIPTDTGLPCSGVTIADLKPAQLAMLIGKVARLVHEQGERWVPLLGSLQIERARRLERGRKAPVEG